jgi:hypothetical protein
VPFCRFCIENQKSVQNSKNSQPQKTAFFSHVQRGDLTYFCNNWWVVAGSWQERARTIFWLTKQYKKARFREKRVVGNCFRLFF